MARIVFFSSSPGFRFPQSRDRLWEFLAALAYCGAICGAASIGWTRGGLLWAVLYALLALVSFPFVFMLASLVFFALYPLLASPGSWVATRLGWTNFGPYAQRRLWLQRISVVLLLLPLATLLQQYPWWVSRILTGIATLGLLLVVVLMCVLILILTRVYRSAAQQASSQNDAAPTFRWIKPDPPRLPPPE